MAQKKTMFFLGMCEDTARHLDAGRCIICSKIHFTILLLLSSVKFHVVYDYRSKQQFVRLFSFPIYIPVQLLHLFTSFDSLSLSLFSSHFFHILLVLVYYYATVLAPSSLQFLVLCAVHWDTNLMRYFQLDKMIKPKCI